MRRTSKPGRVILKMLISVDETGRRPYAYPDLLLLADAAGWKHLAAICRDRAAKARSPRPKSRHLGDDPEDHDHLALITHADRERSDLVDIRLGTICDQDWAVLRRGYQLTKRHAAAHRGAKWMAALAATALQHEASSAKYMRLFQLKEAARKRNANRRARKARSGKASTGIRR